MAKYDALIHKTFAIQYFERVTWDREPLVVLIKQGLGSELFTTYLLDIAGYSRGKLRKCSKPDLSLISEVRMCTMSSRPAIFAKLLQLQSQSSKEILIAIR